MLYDIIFPHKQQAKGTRTAIACNRRGCFLQIHPFKRTILPHQILDIVEPFLIHPGICDKYNTPVDLKHDRNKIKYS